MNSIERMTFFQYILFRLRLPFLQYKWMRDRNITYQKFLDFRDNAQILEQEIQGLRKKRDELELTKERNRDGYYEIKGFVEGIDWVMSKDWRGTDEIHKN